MNTIVTASLKYLKDIELIKAWGPMLALIVSLVTNIVVIRVQNLQNKRQYNLLRSKEERDEIIRKMNSFYGPFKELRTLSRLLYIQFQRSLSNSSNGQADFRTLSYLLKKGPLTHEQEALLREILEVNRKLIQLIQTSVGVVDKAALQELLGKFAAHATVLQLAYDKKLDGPSSDYEDIVFPRSLDGSIESAILRLEDRLRELSGNPMPRVQDIHDRQLKHSIAYYDKNAPEYVNFTYQFNLYELHKEFRKYLPIGGRVLDAGCGAGRDTRYFIEHGYIVIAFDASKAMVQKCSEYPHAYCRHMTFNQLDYHEEFDGVWACASLVHLDKDSAIVATRRLLSALRDGGVMLISLKEGSGTLKRQGRTYVLYDENSIEQLVKTDPRAEIIRKWSSDSQVRNETVRWVNVIVKKKKGMD